MKLYHFTSWHHLHCISRHGLTVGDVPTDIRRIEGRVGVWLTSDETARGHGLTGATVDKGRYRLTVTIPEDIPALVKWIEWGAKNATSETVAGLHATASAYATWYVYFGVIPPSAIEECVDMQNRAVVKEWRDTPDTGIVRCVPPCRRQAWHKRLMKRFRKRGNAAVGP
jgi:hypothetical protein